MSKVVSAWLFCIQPTYEELKLKRQVLDNLPVIGIQPTYEELKHSIQLNAYVLDRVSSLPMRN